MAQRDSGFSMMELLVVVLVLGLITAMAIPQGLAALKAYKLHSDAAAVAGQLNVTRFRATSQFSPFRLNIDTSTTAHIFRMERLCGRTLSTVDSNCTSAYEPFTNRRFEGGPQYLASGDSFSTTNPGGTTSYPGTITGGSGAENIYFNTRGMPVNNSGDPIPNGGAVIYVTNNAGLTDAVVVSIGGRITVYNWVESTSTWIAR